MNEELTGAELDLAVAKFIGLPDCSIEEDGNVWQSNQPDTTGIGAGTKILARQFSPSTEWFEGGKLIEEYEIGIWKGRSIDNTEHYWCACSRKDVLKADARGDTPLIAAMRALIKS